MALTQAQRNKKRRRSRDLQNMLDEGGVTPHGYILGILRQEETFDQHRFDAAKTLLPYVLPKLASIKAEINHNHHLSHEEALKLLMDDD